MKTTALNKKVLYQGCLEKVDKCGYFIWQKSVYGYNFVFCLWNHMWDNI